MEAEYQSACKLDFDLLEQRTPEHAHDDLDQSDDSSESCDLSNSNMSNESNKAERDVVPKIDMEFESQEEAYKFYNEYGRIMGFSVRKSMLRKRANGEVRIRVFCCNQEGYKNIRRSDPPAYKPRASWRSGCLAHIAIRQQPNGKFRVTEFEANHNHTLVTPRKAHMLKSQRRMTTAQAAEAELTDGSGLNLEQTYELMSKQAGGRENLGFLLADYNNRLRTQRQTEMQKGEAGAVLEYFQKMQLQNPSFFYAIQLDVNDLITNIFWADARMVVDYSHFGDVVCFDTTYRTNNADRPFAAFVGVNHHRQTIIFGAALLFDETIDSFVWLFNCFINTMSGKKPKTIFTDPCKVMDIAIQKVFGNETHHRICVWHMFQNATKHLSHVFNVSKTFKQDFNSCIYDHEDEDEFVMAWETMLNKYNLRENKWLEQLFKEREKWALVYGRHTFCADMNSTQRSENLNALLGNYLNSKFNLIRLLNQFEKVLADRRYAELQADFKMNQTTPQLATHADLLEEASRVYTPVVFEKFEIEVIGTLNCKYLIRSEVGTVIEYEVKESKKRREHTVIFDSSNKKIDCSCKNFEFVGILCRHALKILQIRNINEVPSQYIIKRWRKNAKDGDTFNNRGYKIKTDFKAAFRSRYKELLHNFVEIAARAAESEEAFNFTVGNSRRLLHGVEEILKRSHIEGTARTESLRVENVSALGELSVTEANEAICRDENDTVNVDSSNHYKLPRGIKRKEKCDISGRKMKSAVEIQAKKNRSHAPQKAQTIQFTQETMQSTEEGSHGFGVNLIESQLHSGHYMVSYMFPQHIPFMCQATNINSHPFMYRPPNLNMRPSVQESLNPSYFPHSAGSNSQLWQGGTDASSQYGSH